MQKILFALISFVSIISFSFGAQVDCLDREGNLLSGDLTELSSIMKSQEDRPQAFTTGRVISIQKEDHSGLPHQKFVIAVTDKIKIQVVTNLVFGRIPLQSGTTLSVCGEFKKVGSGMIHWTHFDPRGSHPNGFVELDGEIYGNEMTQFLSL